MLKSQVFVHTLIFVICLSWAGGAKSQTVRIGLFGAADAVRALADSARADILAPKSYAAAVKHYQRAEADFSKGRNLELIERELAQSVSYFNAAIGACELATLTFANALRARSDALKAEAPQYADGYWRRAASKFEEAGRRLEDGNVKDAKEKSDEAESLFREAELKAIKTNYLDEARTLIRDAKAQKVDRVAPRTLQRAEQLLAQAESELSENRYDTDRPRNLAREAKYEARHALHIASIIWQMDEKDRSLEDLLLDSEKPLSRIAAAVDVVPDFSKGFDVTTTSIVERVETTETALLNTKHDLSESQQRVVDLEKELRGVDSEREEIQRRAEAHEYARRQLRAVENMFSRDEARVLREGTDIFIRLTGLDFAPGGSEIRPEDFELLTKVEGAIREFPGCSVEVRGHTDSYGTDAENQALSERRAEAVRRYILANMSGVQVQAAGFGEKNPLANNETPEGRARNRRIEIVIKPGDVSIR